MPSQLTREFSRTVLLSPTQVMYVNAESLSGAQSGNILASLGLLLLEGKHSRCG